MEQRYEKKGYLLEDFRLFHLRDHSNTKTDYHYHEFYKLLFLVSGSGGYSVEGKRYDLKSGDVVLIGKHCIHRPEFESQVPYERIIIYISPEFLTFHSSADCDLTEIFSGAGGHTLRLPESKQKKIFSQVTDFEQELSSAHFGREILCSSLLLRLLVEIGRNLRKKELLTPSPVLPKSKRIMEIIQYLDAHLTEDFCIEDLSEKFYFSRYHMMRRFREETGTTIHTYVSDRRLLLAKDLISRGTPSTDACFQCGFRSYASFSRAYSKFFGTTPTGRKISAAALEETYE